MSGRSLESESLKEIERALGVYIDSVSESVNNLRINAQDCSDNMESDTFSQRSVQMLGVALTNIDRAINNARDIQSRIQRKIREIEEADKKFKEEEY